MTGSSSTASTTTRRWPAPAVVIWHDVEHGGYAADLPLWRELAADARLVLEVGCGTGRVALDLAAAGRCVEGVDCDPKLVAALLERARTRGLDVATHTQDVCVLDLDRPYDLVIAPMQVVQLLRGSGARAAFLRRLARHLVWGGRLAAALADPLAAIPADGGQPPTPDMREIEGWTFSSLPLPTRRSRRDGALELRRLRQAVSPAGELLESLDTVLLDALSVGQLEDEAARAGFRAEPSRRIPETDFHVGSDVAVLRWYGDG